MATGPHSSELGPEVPEASHYAGGYVGRWRIHSYAHQLEAIVAESPRTVLEVGVGAGVVAAVLRCAGVTVTTLDIEPSLRPDVVGSVTAIPLCDEAVDVAVSSQVLEHLPFAHFPHALRELRRVVSSALILSIPDRTRAMYLMVQLPIIGRRALAMTLPRLWPRPLSSDYMRATGHYWEIGSRGSSLAAVRRSIAEAGWTIDRTWRVPQMTWHRFFVLRRAHA